MQGRCRGVNLATTPRHPRQRAWLDMCGGCAKEPMVSLYPGDIVRYTCPAAAAGPGCIGRVEALDPAWGIGVRWEHGERSWFSYDSWCPLQPEENWAKWSLSRTTEPFNPADSVVAVPEEPGLGWLAKPPRRRPISCGSLGLLAQTQRKRKREEIDSADVRCVEID